MMPQHAARLADSVTDFLEVCAAGAIAARVDASVWPETDVECVGME